MRDVTAIRRHRLNFSQNYWLSLDSFDVFLPLCYITFLHDSALFAKSWGFEMAKWFSRRFSWWHNLKEEGLESRAIKNELGLFDISRSTHDRIDCRWISNASSLDFWGHHTWIIIKWRSKLYPSCDGRNLSHLSAVVSSFSSYFIALFFHHFHYLGGFNYSPTVGNFWLIHDFGS